MGRRRPTRVEPPRLPDTLHSAFPDHTVDLHGLRAYEVEALLDRLLTNWSRQQPGAILRIITGKGNRSQDGPVLLGVVREVLQDELGGRVQEMVLDSNGGGWVVRVGKG